MKKAASIKNDACDSGREEHVTDPAKLAKRTLHALKRDQHVEIASAFFPQLPQDVRGWRRTRVHEESGRTQGHPGH
jgi:hypothetical protein